jgi:hypothetical protein
MRTLSTLLVGLGVGIVAGAYLGAAAVWPGVVIGLVGVALSFVRSRETAVGPDAAVSPPDERPGLAGLGTRVEQILRLAEEQADGHRATAERTLAEARAEADRILERARSEAAGLTAGPPEADRSRAD